MSARQAALKVLVICRKEGGWSNGALKEVLAKDGLDRREAALAARLCYGVVQNRLLLDHYLKQLLTGKMIKYNEDGHRKKEKYATSWIHTKLFASGWYDENKVAYKTTYFGMHLIDFFPNATINIVESEKTALICSIYWGHPEINLWIACGGMSMLTRERMMPLIERGRRVSLFPDHDGLEMWTKQAEQIGYDGINIQSSFINLTF